MMGPNLIEIAEMVEKAGVKARVEVEDKYKGRITFFTDTHYVLIRNTWDTRIYVEKEPLPEQKGFCGRRKAKGTDKDSPSLAYIKRLVKEGNKL